MKTKKLIPRNTAPVKRENVPTVSRDASAIAPQHKRRTWDTLYEGDPFAGEDAE